MSPKPIRRSNSATVPETPIAKKPAASVKEVPRGDFVSIHSRAVLLDKLEEIANLANEATRADGIAVALREGDEFLCRASLGFAPEPGIAVHPGEGVCGQCLAESRLVLAQDLSGEVKSALAAPVVIGGKVQGLIAAFSFRSGAFAASHSELLCCLASDIAQGLDSLESIHLVTRESIEFVPPMELKPTSFDERLAIIEAVTAPVPAASAAEPARPAEAATVAQPLPAPIESEISASNNAFRFMGYAQETDAAYDFDEEISSHRPFRNHWDVVIILAAILIAALTFGIWLRHRHNQPYQPYNGQLAKPSPLVSQSMHPTAP